MVQALRARPPFTNMEKSRLEILQEFIAARPGDSFARYGLAQEYLRRGELAPALEHFQALLQANPNYSAAYFHGGQTLEKLGRLEEARDLYRKGIEVAGRLGDLHAKSEMQTALDLLP